MAEKAEKKPDAAPTAAAAAPAAAAAAAGKEKKGGIGGMLGKMPVIMGGVMILEAAVLFAGFKFLGGGPSHANAAAKLETELKAEDKNKGPAKTVEVPVLEFKAPNKVSGRTFIYDVTVCVRTKAEFEQRMKETIKANENLIKDRVRTIIEQNDPEKLGGGSEPELATLRRQVKHQLDEILGEGMIEEVLVPRCIPFRTDF